MTPPERTTPRAPMAPTAPASIPQGAATGLIIVGGGVMGSAVARGAVAAALFAPARLTVVETDPARAQAAADEGWTTAHDATGALAAAAPTDPVLLAVKPQSFDAVSQSWRGKLRGRLVLSIMAGIPAARLIAQLHDQPLPATDQTLLHPATPPQPTQPTQPIQSPGLPPRIVRIMSNTPARIGRGCTAIAPGPGATAEDLAWCSALCRVLGPAVIAIDEPLMDAFTGVAGSGPAYLFLLAQSMTAAAVALGLTPADADLAVRHTLLGAAALLAQSPETPDALRAAVTSKGGTTAAALRVFESARFDQIVADAITAARDRGRELSGA
ncbi:MAG: pyrroline-5-carboxylate reductase [Planctomyces sp.]|nr:pyrroline-5-carboxylate reductase [Planctomyces sp.]